MMTATQPTSILFDEGEINSAKEIERVQSALAIVRGASDPHLPTLAAPMADVRAFHDAFASTPVPSIPTAQTIFLAERRAKWIEEEMDELRQADTVAEQADAYIDAIYFALGGLIELGIDPSPLWNLTHAANMAKLQPDGTVLRDPVTRKVIKPADWVDPTPAQQAEVERQIRAALRGHAANS